ncbi:Dps family protein [Asticcacaulis sp. AC402]|uniref:Dps family protein n=1 Tax=Asticcacaulis sp. AC402 TaxID=1282361 RepID=UPI0003C3B62B|nr:DNA starvation/stationary phase protection protein [Asticcacaulis sp. AC402]ESQ75592.1 ferritin [Asticcacaulis sp. AC402]
MADTVVSTEVDHDKTVGKALSQVLADSYTLYLKTHGYHWNVRGLTFRSLHLLFMDQYTEQWTALDEIAERILALGQAAPMTNTAFAKLTSVSEGDPSKAAEDMVRDLAEGHRQVITSLKALVAVSEKAGDGPSQDLANTRLAAHEKHLWMLSATLG